MANKTNILPVEVKVGKQQARRFLLAHQRLLPPRRLAGKVGVLDFIRHVNCIQYDPINVVGQNPHLVLQARVRNYKPAMLDELLYKDRLLMDGLDKVMSIYPVKDWPYFTRHRLHTGKEYKEHESTAQATKLLDQVRNELEKRGPLSSLELEEDSRMAWWWGNNARAVRIALEILFFSGEVVVHHRVGTRRYFELTDRALDRRLSQMADPHETPEMFMDWHVLRRIGSIGLARPSAANLWGGIIRAQGGGVRAALRRLLDQGKIARVHIEDLPGKDFVVRKTDLLLLEQAASKGRAKARAAFLAPLDNVMWDRDLLEYLFNFFYRWEVYVPTLKREYGYYVLPVLFGDQLVARFDPAYNKAKRAFVIQNWWWQDGVNRKDEDMLAAMQDCLAAFAKYLGAEKISLGDRPKRDRVLKAAATAAMG